MLLFLAVAASADLAGLSLTESQRPTARDIRVWDCVFHDCSHRNDGALSR
jgi:hypothetical protein